MVHLLSKEDKSMAAIANNPSLVAALCSATRFPSFTVLPHSLFFLLSVLKLVAKMCVFFIESALTYDSSVS